ncbi:ROK family protein [bacterium]|nr:ROK family protein [bacterium]
MADKTFVGVDLGGTTITAGAVADSKILTEKTVPTCPDRTADEICGTIAGLIGDVANGHRIQGIGIGVPNPAGPESDALFLVANIPALESYPLKSRLTDHFHVPVSLENDARCMALGEHRAGALKGCSHCICITLGTGLGCGIIVDGKIYRGSSYGEGEIWNIPWNDGLMLEDRVGLRGLKAICKSITGSDIEPSALYERYRDGDKQAGEIFDRYGETVGAVMVMILSTLDPERIAIGGGIAKAFDAFRDGMARNVEKSWGKDAPRKIVPAALSSRAAILGAAALIEETVYG